MVTTHTLSATIQCCPAQFRALAFKTKINLLSAATLRVKFRAIKDEKRAIEIPGYS